MLTPETGRKPKTSWIVSSLSDVSKFFKVHADTSRSWRLGADPMPGAAGRWDLSEIAVWRLRRAQKAGLAEELRSCEIRLKTAMSVAKELANEVAAGELLSRRDVELWASQAIIEFRVTVMALPERLSVNAPPEIRSFIRSESDRHCRDSLVALRRRLETDRIDEPPA
jgi:hypothetical protein